MIYNPTTSGIGRLILMMLLLSVLGSCSGRKDVVYIQNIETGVTMALQEPRHIKLQPGDKLDIVVHSRDEELVEMFNLTHNAGDSHYTVDDLGQIEMPILGIINVKGLTRLELANLIKYKLLASKLIRDPIVSVEYHDMAYYTVGFGSGRTNINRDKLTLLEVIAESGGLPLNTQHDNVLVLRTENGKQTPYRVNLLDVNDLYSSPVYYIQQNDVIYAEPTEDAALVVKPMGNTWRNPMFWVGFLNTVLSFGILFSK